MSELVSQHNHVHEIGSVYYDRKLVMDGFVGETVTSAAVLLYKIHGRLIHGVS